MEEMKLGRNRELERVLAKWFHFKTSKMYTSNSSQWTHRSGVFLGTVLAESLLQMDGGQRVNFL